MNWYIAKIVYRILSGSNTDDAQFDEQLRLIYAADKTEAFYKAQQTGKKEEDVFMNANQQMVQWKFINVTELYRLREMIDGAELYSRIEERGNADAYIETINRKAAGIMHSETHQILQLV